MPPVTMAITPLAQEVRECGTVCILAGETVIQTGLRV